MQPVPVPFKNRPSDSQQHPSRLSRCGRRHFAQRIVAGAADRMRDDRKCIAGKTQHPRHQFGRADEARGHHRHRRDTQFLGRDGVMQTARRATASVADTSDNSLPAADLVHDIRVSRCAVVGFRAADNFGYAEFLACVVRDFGVAAVIVSSLIGHSLDALRSGLPTLIVGHDFYPLWPLLHRDFGDPRLAFDERQLDADLAAGGAGFEFAERDARFWRVLREAYGKAIIPAFQKYWKEKTGQDVEFNESYQGSGAQSRAIIGGFEADIAALSLEGDIDKIADAGLITHDWKAKPNHGMISDSIVVIAVRKGNPKGIRDWPDLAKPGLNVLTGETGSGKSLLVDALALVLGGRASPDVIRTGANRATVTAVFRAESVTRDMSNDEVGVPLPWSQWLERYGIGEAEGEVILRREIHAGGRSRLLVNDQPVTLAAANDLAPLLIEIHGQGEHPSLVGREAQLDLLDTFARTEKHLDSVRHLFAQRQELRREWTELNQSEQERLRALDLLRFQVDEITQARLSPGEDERLESERAVLRNIEKVRLAAASAYAALY